MIALLVAGLIAWTLHRPLGPRARPDRSNLSLIKLGSGARQPQRQRDEFAVAAELDAWFADRWRTAGIEPAELADELTVLRRLSLALHGVIPSLEMIREFEADRLPDRLARWTDRLLDDPRFADHFARRLGGVLVANEQDDFPNFRAAHFFSWFADRLREGRPYDEIVRTVISQTGQVTIHSAGNFVTAELLLGEGFEDRLAARTARAALGQRIDCAQCHDHPFAEWTQADFQGLAAFFGQTRLSPTGLEDRPSQRFEVRDPESLETQIVEPRVPFAQHCLPTRGTSRQRLAHWLTHPDNHRFSRATVNRVWGLVLGRPWVTPVDDLPDPVDESAASSANDFDPLDRLASDFREQNHDLRRLIRVIVATQPFRLSSAHPEANDEASAERLAEHWAVFPLVRLRPRQWILSLQQAATIRTLPTTSEMGLFDLANHERLLRQFHREFGEVAEEDLDERLATIPQALLGLYGRFTRDASRVRLLSGPGRVAMLASTDEECLDAIYLSCLARRPTEVERVHFLDQFQSVSRGARGRLVEDIYWALYNSPEFSWNH